MSLRWKISVAVAVVVAVVVGSNFLIAQYTFVRGFQTVEDKNTVDMAGRAESVLSDQINSLNTLNHDWAAWDDTYNFVEDPSAHLDYIQSNPTDTTFASAGLNFLFIINAAKKVVYAKGFDLDAKQQFPVPDSLSEQMAGDTFTQHQQLDDKISGVVMVPQGPLLVSSLPIVTSDGQGPIAGTIIMAQYLDSKLVSRLSGTLHLPLTVVNANETNIPSDFAAARSALSAKTPEASYAISAQTIGGYALINDIYGKPVLILRVEMPRDIYTTGLNTTRYFLFALLGLAVICGITLFTLLGKLVVTRIRRMAEFVSHIGNSGVLSATLLVEGKDELSTLGKNINGMVEALQNSQELLQKQKKAEEKLRLTIESVAEGIATTDLNGRIIDANDSKVLLHGYSTKGELICKSSLDLIAPEERGKAVEAMERTLETGQSGSTLYIMQKKDGSKFFGERSLALLRGPEGEPFGFVISTKDVTERKRAEENLLRSEEKYSTIVEKGNDGIIIIQDGLVKFANSKMLELTGYPSGEILGQSFIDFIAPAYRGLTAERYKARIAGEQISNKYEIALLTKDKKIAPVEINANRIEFEGKAADMAIVRDTTERKKAEETLKASEAKFRNLVENAAAGILMTLPDGQILSANKAALEIYGYSSAEQFIDRSVVVHYANPEDRKRLLELTRNNGVAQGFETRMIRNDGTLFWASLNVITQTNESGDDQFIAIIEDITARKESEVELSRLYQEVRSFNRQLEIKVEERTRQLAEAVDEAKASNQAKSEFLASMSHELRTPLNAIIGFSQLLDAQYFGNLNEKQTEYVNDILESGRHLLSLINDILDLSKIEAGKMEIEKSCVKLAELLRGSLVMVKEKALAHHINLEVNLAPEIENLTIEADERKFKQVMFNLLSNATKFTADGGAIKVESIIQNKDILISVADTGIGLSAKEQTRLFEAFYQASGGITGKTPGTGLGLNITKSIVEKHGGRIWAESDGPGKGSRFSFTLPVRVEAGVPK